jgi:hypothetical protein
MRALLVAAGVVVAIVLFVILRPDDDEPESVTPAATTTTAATTATTTPSTTEATTTTPAPAPKPKPKVATIRITIQGGRPVDGIRRASVRKGGRVRLVVRSDVSDHVHLHGYDIFRDVAPGSPAQISFRATIAGRFEVELEDRGLQIADIEVRP